MKSLPPKVQERLQQLAGKFHNDLPNRLSEIQSLTTKATSGDEESIRELHNLIHRIAGGAATFGFQELTDRARAVERLIERDLSGEPRTLGSDTRDLLERIYSDSTLIETHAPDKPNGVTDSFAKGTKVVFQVGDIQGLTGELAEQLSVFGMQYVRIASLEGVDDAIAERVDDLNNAMVIILATVDFFRAKATRLKQLSQLRTLLHQSLITVLVGDEDDFETRLRSVRYGAQAFLSSPIDVISLVDRIEGMINEDTVAPFHVLVVDDDPEQVSNTALVLQDAGMITSVVTDPTSIFQVLVDYKPELILMDMYMPTVSGTELTAIIRQNLNYVGIPIVFLSAETDAQKQLEAVQSGGDGFLTKPIGPNHLVTSVRIRAARTRAMRFFMERDSLTGLLNHTNLKERLDQEIQRARRIDTELAFVMIDLDKFKSVNDTWGHLTGDRVLKSLARLLEKRLRRTDIVGRYGGEEFGVILFNTNVSAAQTIMDEIRESFAGFKHFCSGGEFFVTFSCGIAGYPAFESGAEVSEAADSALYKAKQAGRNRVIVAER